MSSSIHTVRRVLPPFLLETAVEVPASKKHTKSAKEMYTQIQVVTFVVRAMQAGQDPEPHDLSEYLLLIYPLVKSDPWDDVFVLSTEAVCMPYTLSDLRLLHDHKFTTSFRQRPTDEIDAMEQEIGRVRIEELTAAVADLDNERRLDTQTTLRQSLRESERLHLDKRMQEAEQTDAGGTSESDAE